jgi:ATP-dependent Clp protease ATP-binding subunit ClpC
MIKRVKNQLRSKDLDLELTDDAQGLARREGLRPAARRPAAASHHPARARGQALRADPARRVHAGQLIVADVDEEDTVAFRAVDSPRPDAPPVELAGGDRAADGHDE